MQAVINGRKLWYDVRGESGTPVVLIMGFGISGRAWQSQVSSLEQTHRVLFFDNRGVGESEACNEPYDFTDLARDVVDLMDHVGFDDAHLAGVSMGGMVAQHVALAHRSRVRSLTLIATHPGPIYRSLPTVRALQLFLRANLSRGEKRLQALRRLLFVRGLQNRSTSAGLGAGFLEVIAEPADKAAVRRQLAAIVRHDTTGRLKQLAGIPTLIIRPDRDVLVPPSGSDRLHGLIPDSVMVAVAEAGHGITHESAEVVNRHLEAHLGRVDQSRS